ncbi:MAG: single-stranded DNA-binding protein [Armatimonadota bacterium]
MNRFIGIGYLAQDPDFRYTPGGTAVATFDLAIQREHQNSEGEREADFLPCITWRGLAEFTANHLAKGARVAIEGRIESRRFTGQDGTRRKVWECKTDRIQVLTWPREREDEQERDDEAELDGPHEEELPAPAPSEDEMPPEQPQPGRTTRPSEPRRGTRVASEPGTQKPARSGGPRRGA